MRFWKGLILFYIGGMLYVGMELVFRGWSHPSMFVVGGLCFLLLGLLARHGQTNRPLWIQAVLGAAAITAVELVSGLLVNVVLGWGVWDYSHLPLNLMGQVCLWFFLLWIPVAGFGCVADGYLRHWLFGEAQPRFRLL